MLSVDEDRDECDRQETEGGDVCGDEVVENNSFERDYKLEMTGLSRPDVPPLHLELGQISFPDIVNIDT